MKDAIKYMYSFLIPVFVSLPVNIFLGLFEKYIIGDWEFLKHLTVIVAVDTILSWIYHFKNKSISSKGFSMLFIKIMSYAVMLILANTARNIDTGVYTDHGGEWVASFICWALFMREGLSIVEKLSLLDVNIVPKQILKYFRVFNENDIDKDTKLNNEIE